MGDNLSLDDERSLTDPVASVKPAEQMKSSKAPMILGILLSVVAVACVLIFIFLGMNDTERKPIDSQKNADASKDDGSTINMINSNSMSDFDISFLKNHDTNQNAVYSPISIKYALSMLKDGAAGESKRQLEVILGSYKPKLYTKSENLAVANAIFVKDEYKDAMKADYIESVKKKYNASVIYDSFNNVSTMNDWVYENTLSLIPKVLDDEDLDENSIFVLANAVAIDMNWENMIQYMSYDAGPGIEYTSYDVELEHENYSAEIDEMRGIAPMNFDGNQSVGSLEIGATISDYDIVSELGEDYIYETVKNAYEKWLKKRLDSYDDSSIDDYMKSYMKEIKNNYGVVEKSTDFGMYADDKIKMFAKNLKEYDGVQLQYVGVMPVTEDIESFVQNLTAEELAKDIAKLKGISQDNFKTGKITKITGNIPVFSFSDSLDLRPFMEKMGIERVFNPDDAELEPMIDVDENVWVQKAKHAAKIDFSNLGIKAAGATMITGGVGAAIGRSSFDYVWDVPVEEINLDFDKPFIFLIRDKNSGEVWFMGAVYEPTAYQSINVID